LRSDIDSSCDPALAQFYEQGYPEGGREDQFSPGAAQFQQKPKWSPSQGVFVANALLHPWLENDPEVLARVIEIEPDAWKISPIGMTTRSAPVASVPHPSARWLVTG
jgi:hypothetical protein